MPILSDFTAPRASAAPARMAAAALLLLLGACGGGSGDEAESELNPPPQGDFEIMLGGVDTLVEGSGDALFIPFTVDRVNGHERQISLTIAAADEADSRNLDAQFIDDTLDANERDNGVRLTLGVDILPIMPGSRRIWLTASDGIDEDRIGVDVRVQPTDAPDVYLLAGQSNMVGFSGEATRQAEPGGADASDPRIRQLNVSANDPDEIFVTGGDFTSREKNVQAPALVIAEDPLHRPRSEIAAEGDNGKDEQYIGLGLSFAKRALLSTTADIVLVPTAWSGSSFCENDNGPQGNWNPDEGNDALGNTLLFDRAVLRANLALDASGGVLRGILWHQGESDANEVCGPIYGENLDRLAAAFRSRIQQDRRGEQARGDQAAVPFVVGTLSRGIDEREDLSDFSPAKQSVDDAIRATADRQAYAAVSNHDDLVPANGFPCGDGSCIHFGAAALREMGRRYHEALERAALDR